MKPWIKWTLALLMVALVAGFVARAINARQQTAKLAAAEQAKPVPALALAGADVLVAQTAELTRTLTISGGLKAVNTAVVKAKVAAEVKSLIVREGDSVRAGQVIGQLDTLEVDLRLQQAEQNAASARAQLDITQRALVNNRALVAQGFISATGLETSISNEAAAQAVFRATAAAADLVRKTRTDSVLIAPISGLVSQRSVQVGERVGVDARIVEVVDLSRLELEAAVAPEEVGGVSIGQTARLRVDGLTEMAQAKVVRINPSTQAGTRSVMVYLAVQSQPGLRQGLFARGSVELERTQALVVPVSAVRVDQARPYVLVVLDGKVLQRSVTLGAHGQAMLEGERSKSTLKAAARTDLIKVTEVTEVVEITSGLSAGTTLLRGTVGAVRDGTLVKLLSSNRTDNPAPATLGASPAAAAASSAP